MWILTVLMNGEATPTTLQYRTQESAVKSYRVLVEEPKPQLGVDDTSYLIHDVEVGDDYERLLFCHRHSILRVLLQSAEGAMSGDRDAQTLQQISQARLQLELMDNPTIRECATKVARMQQAQNSVIPMPGMVVPRVS
jgi:hypothetical protein